MTNGHLGGHAGSWKYHEDYGIHMSCLLFVEIRSIYYRVLWEKLCGCLIIEHLQVWGLYPHSFLLHSSLTSVSFYNIGLKIVSSYKYCWVADVVRSTWYRVNCLLKNSHWVTYGIYMLLVNYNKNTKITNALYQD